MNGAIATCWPAEYRPALSTVIGGLAPQFRREAGDTFDRFGDWCRSNGQSITISKTTITGFQNTLIQESVPASVKRRMRYLFRLGTAGPDMVARDYLYENCPDRRSIEEMVSAPWWPNVPRLLAASLEVSERKRVISELDNFFRWRQRMEDVPAPARYNGLFLKEGMAPRTEYQRLSRLCIGLDAVFPGEADTEALRARQRLLYSTVWPSPKTPTSEPRLSPEIETLLASCRNAKTGGPLAKATLQARKIALLQYRDVLSKGGHPFVFDRRGLDLFADFVWDRLGERQSETESFCGNPEELGTDDEPGKYWCFISAATRCESLAPFISDKDLRKRWYGHCQYLRRESANEEKRKERKLAEAPTDLDGLFRVARELLDRSDGEMNTQTRHGMFVVLGALGVLLFYPLRRADLLALRIGHELERCAAGWLLQPGFTGKTGSEVHPLLLPLEATPFLDACLLQGRRRDQLQGVYEERKGQPVLKSSRGSSAYCPEAFSKLFSRQVGYSPHMFRSLWCDYLVEIGADRITISAMLQHESLISQEDYEIVASKIRRLRAVRALNAIADTVLSGGH